MSRTCSTCHAYQPDADEPERNACTAFAVVLHDAPRMPWPPFERPYAPSRIFHPPEHSCGAWRGDAPPAEAAAVPVRTGAPAARPPRPPREQAALSL